MFCNLGICDTVVRVAKHSHAAFLTDWTQNSSDLDILVAIFEATNLKLLEIFLGALVGWAELVYDDACIRF